MLFFKSLLFVIQIFSALFVICFVLLQNGKGATSGFANIGSDSLFGAKGSSNFLSRATAIAVTLFFISTLGTVAINNKLSHSSDLGVMSTVTTEKHNTDPNIKISESNISNNNSPKKDINKQSNSQKIPLVN